MCVCVQRDGKEGYGSDETVPFLPRTKSEFVKQNKKGHCLKVPVAGDLAFLPLSVVVQ